MSESCTLFCEIQPVDLESFRKRLSILEFIEIEGDDSWDSIRCTTSTGSVRFSRKVFEQPADSFSKLIARTIVFIERRMKESPGGRALVSSHLERTEAAIGIVAEPSFDEIQKLSELIHFLMVEFNALLFNGENMLDVDGNVVA